MTYTDEHIKLWVQNWTRNDGFASPTQRKSATIIRELMEERDQARAALVEIRDSVEIWYGDQDIDFAKVCDIIKKGLGA